MGSVYLTRRALSLGARDSETNWAAKVFAESQVIGLIYPAGAVFGDLYCKHPHTLITPDVCRRGDEYKDYQGQYYRVDAVDQWWRGNQFIGYIAKIEKIHSENARPASSGTWHEDSDSVTTDVRLRQKSWLDTNLDLDDIDGDVLIQLAGIDYPFEHEFNWNALDVVIQIDNGSRSPVYGWDKKPYKFSDTALIHVYAINRASGKTAPNILEQTVKAIEHVATDHPLGSVRRLVSSVPNRMDFGQTILWHTLITLDYEVANEYCTPAYPYIIYDPLGTPTAYILPNALKVPLPLQSEDVTLHPPGFTGALTQAMGSGPLEVTVECDLDFEASTVHWRRDADLGQDGASPSDKNNFDFFLYLLHQQGINQPYCMFVTEHMNFGCRLVSMAPVIGDDGNKITLTFREFMYGTAAAVTYKTRWGIT